jgi:hypothetical protein
MAPKGSPRDMNKWRETLHDPDVKFPGESNEYRRARNQLLEAEDELRRLTNRSPPSAGRSRQADSSQRTTSSSARPMAAR